MFTILINLNHQIQWHLVRPHRPAAVDYWSIFQLYGYLFEYFKQMG